MSGASGAGAADGGPLQHLVSLSAEFHRTVTECLGGAEEEAVHRVRTGSRRVEALLETIMRTGSRGSGTARHALEDASKRWFRQLDKVRRAAGKVRDLDVHRKIVSRHFLKDAKKEHPAGEEGGPEPLPGQVITMQAEALDAWLKGKREKPAARLIEQLRKRQPKLLAAERAFTAALPAQRRDTPGASRSAKALALEDFLRLVDAMPQLDADNLHDFRKGTKKARYVAETGGDDPEAKAIAKALNKVQDDIGDWHDWLVLGEEAKTALGGDGGEIQAAIDGEVRRLFARAMASSERLRRRALGEWLATRRPQRGRKQLVPAQAAGNAPAAAKVSAGTKAATGAKAAGRKK